MFDKIEAGGCEPPTKQFWVPVTEGTLMTNMGDYPVCCLQLWGEFANMSFYTPDDFHQIREVYIVVIGQCIIANPSWATNSDYGKAGEMFNAHSSNVWTRPASVALGIIYEIDISSALPSLEAKDYVGLAFYIWDDAHDVDVLGVMFKYD